MLKAVTHVDGRCPETHTLCVAGVASHLEGVGWLSSLQGQGMAFAGTAYDLPKRCCAHGLGTVPQDNPWGHPLHAAPGVHGRVLPLQLEP